MLKNEFCIPILRDKEVLDTREIRVFVNFLFDYSIKPVRFIRRNQSLNAIYSIQDLQDKYNIYLSKKHTKKDSERSKIIKKLLKELQ